MVHLQLFLGYPLDKSCEAQLQKVNPDLLTSFIGDNSAYLQKFENMNGSFLGKKVGRAIDFEALRLAESNIYSLLNRLIPQYPFQETALMLFPIPYE